MTDFLLAYVFPWLVVLALGAIMGTFLISLPAIIRFFRSIPVWATATLLFFTVAGGLIRFLFVPNDHRIYFDEDRYLSYAVTFARFGKAVSLELATPTASIIGTPDEAARVTVPVISAITLRLFGFKETHLLLMAKAISTLTILFMFAAAYLLFENVFIAVFAASGIALLPPMLYFAPSIGFDSFLVSASLVALCTTCWYAKRGTPTSGIALLASIILLICVRVEAILFLFILLAAYTGIRKKTTRNTTLDIAFGSIAGVIILIRTAISISLANKPWCCAEALPLEAFSPLYLFRNVLPNLAVYVSRPEFPAILSVLAVPSIFNPHNWKIKLLNIWLVLFFLLYSSYYAGIFYMRDYSGSYGRYFLMQIPPLLLLAGYTLTRAKRGARVLIVILGLVTLISTLRTYPKLIATSPYDRLVEEGPRVLHQFLDSTFIGETKQNDVIIHNLTAPILLSGRVAVYSGYFYGRPDVQDFVALAIAEGKRVYIDQTHHCDLFPDACTAINSRFKFVPITTKKVGVVMMEMDAVELK